MFLPGFLRAVARSVVAVMLAAVFAGGALAQGFVDPDIAGPVNDIILQSDGRILAGGGFSAVGGQPRSRVARLNENGTLHGAFLDPQLNNQVFAMELQPDGKVVIGGSFVTVGGQTRNYLARLNPDGSLDTSFNSVVSSSVSSVAIQPDGKIIVGGYFTSVGGQSRSRVARLNSDGSLDTTFVDPGLSSPAPSTYVNALTLQPDGKILIGGYFTSVAGQGRAWGTRLNPDGTLDSAFGLNTAGPVEQFRVLPDGKILVCGYFSSVNGTPRTGIVRVNNDGSVDPTFGNVAIPSGTVTVFDVQSDGKLVVGGSFSRIAGVDRRDIARLNSDGTFDPTFQDPNANFGGTFTNLNDIIVQPDGKILIGGSFTTIGHQTRKNLVRLLSDGTLDLPPAQMITVTKVADTNDGACDADCSLREALSSANASPNATAIGFDLQVFGTPRTITLDLGELVFANSRRVTISGPGASLLTISGNNANRIFRVERDVIATIDKLTMSNGSYLGGFGGGAIYVEPNGITTSLTITNAAVVNNVSTTGAGIRTFGSSILNVSNTTFSGNIASGNQGGGAIVFDTGTLNVTNCTITANQSTVAGSGAGGINGGNSVFTLTDSTVTLNTGGGVGAGGTSTITNTTITNNSSAVWAGGLYVGGNVTVNNSTIAGNTVTNADGSGGGIYILGRLSITNSTVTGNSAAFGGGIFTSGGLTMTGTTVGSNSASKTGGGIYNNLGGTSGLPVSITNSVVSDNVAAEFAGGIQNRAVMNIAGSTITGNRANLGGGGIYNVSVNGSPTVMSFERSSLINNRVNAGGGGGFQNQAGTINLTNSTVSSNYAQGAGGGFAISQDGIVNLSFATIAFNNGGTVGGIRITGAGTVNANNSIIARNIGRNSGADFSGQLNSQGYNLLGSVADTTVVGDTTGNILNADPRLDPALRSNGALTFTHALQPNSPATDAGKSSVAVSTDQRGSLRPVDFGPILNAPGGNGSDIGSFELQETDTSRVVSPYDFDGDGKTDIGIFRPSGSASEWWINSSSSGATKALQFGASTDKIVPADYTGDGKADIAFFRPATGEWYVLRSEDYSFFAFPFGTNGDIPAPADYDADGKADPAVFRPSSATWYISRSGGGGTRILQFGVNGDRPVVADYDGDGRADIGIFRPAATGGEWWIDRSTAGILAIQFGAATDKAVHGDYTGDGKADIAVWRPQTGEWLISRSEDFSYYGFAFGASGDLPAPGDYDGDGKFDATVFRPSSATWFIGRTTAGTQIVQFGANGDQPLPNALVP